MKKPSSAFALFFIWMLAATPSAKAETVAPGLPVWEGLVPANHIFGRELCEAYMRHRVVAVIEVDGDKLAAQMEKVPRDVAKSGLLFVSHTVSEETFTEKSVSRDLMCVFSIRGRGKNMKETLHDMERNANKYNLTQQTPFYLDAGIKNAPDTEGKRPYLYVMGMSGEKPIYQCQIKDFNKRDLNAAIRENRKNAPQWRDFFGSVSDPKYTKILSDALGNDKPLSNIETAYRRKIASSKPDDAINYQIVADAIVQTKYDLLYKTLISSRYIPWYSMYNLKTILKYWPELKKNPTVSLIIARHKALGKEGIVLGRAYEIKVNYGKEDYIPKNAGAVKKDVALINKTLASLAPLKESENMTIQNGALVLAPQLENIALALPGRVESK